MPVDYTPLVLIVLIATIPAFAAFINTKAFAIVGSIETATAIIVLWVYPSGFAYYGAFFLMVALAIGFGIIDQRKNRLKKN